MLTKPQEKPGIRFAAGTDRPPSPSRNMISIGLRKNFEILDFAIPPLPPANGASLRHVAGANNAQTRQRRMSDVRQLTVSTDDSLAVRKCIYERLPYSNRDDGFERIFIESLEKDAEVLAHCRLHWKHQLFFHLRVEEDGKPVICHPEFLIRTREAIYMVETGTSASLARPGMRSKLKSAAAWCGQINQLDAALRSGLPWHYVLLLEDAFRTWHERSLPLGDLLAFARLRQPEDPSACKTAATDSAS